MDIRVDSDLHGGESIDNTRDFCRCGGRRFVLGDTSLEEGLEFSVGHSKCELGIEILEGSPDFGRGVFAANDLDKGWSKAKAFVARAVSAHMEHEVAAVKLAEDEDAEADAANDHAYLKAVLKLDDAQNPCCAA